MSEHQTQSLITEKEIDDLVSLRHELHRIAEVSGEEQQTASKIKSFLQKQNPDTIIDDIGGHGLVAEFKGRQEGPSVIIRCELDALPIPEMNEIAYRSETSGVSHKCGHDGHMAIVSGVAKALSELRPQKGCVYLLFQPSEETGQGAERVLNDSKFNTLNPDYIFALHNLPGYPEHQVVIKDGLFAAASRGFVIRLKGETSHAAHPKEGRSPALALSQLIQILSSFPQFYTSLGDPAKVTVIQASLGEIAFGTSPGYAELRATFRTHENEVMEQLVSKAEQMAKDIATSYRLDVETEWTEVFEATVNDSDCNRHIEQAARGKNFDVLVKDVPFAWSEDFGRFTSEYKGAIFGLGAGKKQPQLHASTYDFPDELIRSGATIFLDVIDQLTGLEKL